MEQLKEADEITTVIKPSWDEIMKGCVRVELNIGYWRHRQRNASTDFGFDGLPSEFLDSIKNNLYFGRKRVLPAELSSELEGIESAARATLPRYCFKSPWGWLLTKENYLHWTARIESLRHRFEEIAELIVRTYLSWFDKVRAAYFKQGVVAYAQKNGYTGDLVARLEDGDSDSAVDAFLLEHPDAFDVATEYARKIISRIPPAEEIKALFHFQWSSARVAHPQLIVDTIAIESLERKKADLEAQIMSINVADERLRLALEREALIAKIKTEKAIDADIKSRSAELYKRQIEDTLTNIAVQIRQLVSNTASEVISSIGGKAKVNKKTSGKLARIISEVKSLNFYNDASINDMVSQMEGILSAAESASNETQVAQVAGSLGVVELKIQEQVAALTGRRFAGDSNLNISAKAGRSPGREKVLGKAFNIKAGARTGR